MSVFYCDKKILALEKNCDYSPIIEYLETKYNESKDSQIFITLIASAWYYLVEGDVNKNPKNFDWKYLKSKYKHYIEIGLRDFINDDMFDYIGGYTLYQHWIYVGQEFEGLGIKLIKKCSEIGENHDIQILAQHFLNKSKIIDVEDIVPKLFPNTSELDEYFKNILLSHNV